MQQHADHKLEPLQAYGEKYLAKGKAVDPMVISYIEVTNGQENFLLRRSRQRIEEPLIYEVMKGRILNGGWILEVQENEIKKEMSYHFKWAPALPPAADRIELFIGLLKELVKGIDPNTVRISEYAHTDDAVAYGLLDQHVINALMMKCAAYFLPIEQEALRRFIDAHRESCDVMTLRMCQQFTIEDSAG